MTVLEAKRLQIHISRLFDAPPEQVFAQWTDAAALKDWFTPQTYLSLDAAADPQVGGDWMVQYQSPAGKRFTERGIYQEIVPARRLVMTLNQPFAADAPELVVTVEFEATSGGTLMQFHQTGFVHPEHCEAVALGWNGCMDKLAARLTPVADDTREIEALFDAWFDASTRKDLDASMAPISPEIVSYEHSMPLEIRDIETMRAECKVGFDRAGPQFRWDIPDMKIIIRGDIAVTWGLNRMADETDTGSTAMWSRGTRIFQRIEGRWLMIHQHVSFPMDPATGQARFDLLPEMAA